MKKRQQMAGLILLIAGVLVFTFCTKQEPKKDDSWTVPAVKDDRKERSPTPSPTLPPDKQAQRAEGVISLTPSPQAPKPTSTPRVVTSETGLYAYFPQQRLMAQDFKIGPLQDAVSAPKDFIRAGEVARGFLEGIMNNKVDYSLVAKEAKDAIASVINWPLSQGYIPENYRIGKMAFEKDDEIRANLRLYKGDGVTEGEIYLKKIEADWYVSDLQTGFVLLGRKYEKSKEPFTPGSYRFLLED